MHPAEGERSAVVGFSGQYGLAAQVVLAKLTTLEWVQVADPAAGVADDFQFQSGPTRHALQVKWAQYPGSFGWAELVNPSRGKPPLLRNLAEAWQRLRASWSGPLVIHLRSNEHAPTTTPSRGTPLADCTPAGPRHFAAFLAQSFTPTRGLIANGVSEWSDLIDLDEVKAWHPAWDTLRKRSGLDNGAFVRFVADLSIHFGPPADDPLLRPDHAPADEDLTHLATTLQSLVSDPARPSRLSRPEFLDRLGWADRLRYRNRHAFPIPTVYAANHAARTQLEDRLVNLPGGYIALIGPAGSGKSTLLATLNWQGERVVRYYAFVPDAPDPLSGRGEADSFLHDLSLALEHGGLFRSGYGNDLPSQRTVLFDQFDQAGRQWQDRGQRTIIIVDGLDHIPREQNPSRSLLEELPPPTALPDGVFIVLGTQITAILPAPVQDGLSHDDRTVDLPPLTRQEVSELANGAGPGRWLRPDQQDRLVDVSEGHPLALTYLLQELITLETSELEVVGRRDAADLVLANASTFGAEVTTRYRGYLRATGTDPDLHDLLGTIARVRTSIDLRWLATWVTPHTLGEFEQRTAMFFRRSGSVWHFIHNSFRVFLANETASTAGLADSNRDRTYHLKLAEACAQAGEEWPLYRDEELAHRFLAGQFDRVLALATPAHLREALLRQLRPLGTIRDHAQLALRAAVASQDYSAFLRMLLFLNELSQRQYVLEPEKIAEALSKLGPTHAVEHVVSGSQLRLSTSAALRCARTLIRDGHVDSAAQVFRVIGGLANVIEREEHHPDRTLPDAVADWAEVAVQLSGLDQVLEQIQDHLPLPAVSSEVDDTTEHLADERERWDAQRRQHDQQERDDTVRQARHRAHARCFDALTDLRDEESLVRLLAVIDAEAPPAWRARARVVLAGAAYDDGDPDAVLRWVREIDGIDAAGPTATTVDEEAASPTDLAAQVPLQLRLRAAEFLMRAGLGEAPEVDRLVPPGTGTVWPSVPSGEDGLAPFATTLALWRFREARPGKLPAPQETFVPDGDRGVGNVRFRQALRVLATLEGQYLASQLGLGQAPLVAAEANPIIRLLEVPFQQTRDWTGWYAVRDAAPHLFGRLLRLAAAAGGS